MGLLTCAEVFPFIWLHPVMVNQLQSRAPPVGDPFSRAKPQVFGLQLHCAESTRTLIVSLLLLWQITHSKTPACVILPCGSKLHISFLLFLVVVGAELTQHVLKVPLARCPFLRFVPPVWQKLRS